MATATAAPPLLTEADPVVLHHVAWETYCLLRDEEANDAVRMIYLDGELTLMSPEIRHDHPTELLGQLVRAVMTVLGSELRAIGSTTLRRAGPAGRGAGKEPDTAYYFDTNEERMRGRRDLDLRVDPPPDLAIEVDNSRNSAKALAVYARLGVPEVWRYSAPQHSIGISRLDGETYREVARSVALPPLTPAAIIEALDRYEVRDLDENGWFEWVKAWVATLPGPDEAA